jgi:uncharacterized membrane protein
MVADTVQGPTRPRRLSRDARKLVLSIHVTASVALLGTTAATLVLALRAATTDDVALADTTYRLMQTLSLALNIPLSVIALVSGIVIGLGTKWGVLRYGWVTIKLALLLVVIAVGALVVGGGVEEAVGASGDVAASVRWRIVGGGAVALSALAGATVLSVYKPGGRWRGRAGRDPEAGQPTGLSSA